MTTTLTSKNGLTNANDTVAKIACLLLAKHGGWNEEYCWYYLRQEFPGMHEDGLRWYADRIELAC